MASQQSLTFTLNMRRGVLSCPRCTWEIDIEILAITSVDLYQLTDVADDHLSHSPDCRR